MRAELFTAQEIGDAIGKTPRSTLRVLGGVPACGTRIVHNKRAAAWTLESLPPTIRVELRAIQVRLHYRSEEDVLSNPPKSKWEPEGVACGLSSREFAA